MNNQISLFLSQSYSDAWDDYLRSLTRPDFARWDYVLLTASNERQAEGFRIHLEERIRNGWLPKQTHFAVLADEGNVRIGSGGATLGVLKYIAEHNGKASFDGLRILVIHSGGDSKRVPQYSALGKLFSPVLHELPDGRVSTLFDEFIIINSGVPSRIRDGMLLLSGDVMLLLNPLQIDFSGEGAAAISVKESVEIGINHGCYLRGANDLVARFLHKQPVELLHEYGAVNEQGDIDLDTGAVIFSSQILAALYGLISYEGHFDENAYKKYVNDTVRLSLYGDFLYPLASESTLEDFYKEKPEGVFSDELYQARTAVWYALRPFRMKLLRLAPAKFIHFGTTREIMRLVSKEISDYSYFNWTKQANSSIADAHVAGYNSILAEDVQCGQNCYLEVSHVHNGAVVGSNTLLSYVDIEGMTIPSDVVLHGLKQRDGRFVVRIYGIEDNPKVTLEEGCTFLGETLEMFMSQNGLTANDIWDDDDRTLWTAKLYPTAETIKEAVEAALNLYDIIHKNGDIKAWRSAERKSLMSGFGNADPRALIDWGNRMSELVRMERLMGMIQSGRCITEAQTLLQENHLTAIQKEWLEDRQELVGLAERMRLHYFIGHSLEGADGQYEISKSFSCLRRALVEEIQKNINSNRNPKIVKDSHVVRLPLRVNWGGSWSDTPPYCIEKGGTILNAAILLNGKKPVEVTLTRLDEPKIVFASQDSDTYGEFTEIQRLQRTGDPFDPFALQKATLLACGILPSSGGDLRTILDGLGGGFRMQTEVTGVPKGSGLGTSSILAAACVKALFEFMGISYSQQELYRYVLAIEQIMSTGGGWQDQVGGLSVGIKYSRTSPGVDQEIHVETVEISEETKKELNERFALIYTGQRRLARNLLRDVVGRYLGNEPEVIDALNEVQKVAALARFELERGNIDGFAMQLNQHWKLSKKIDLGSTNTVIEQIFSSIDDLIIGRMICGAGGGGFLQVVLKKGITRDELHSRLKTVFRDNNIDIWNCMLI